MTREPDTRLVHVQAQDQDQDCTATFAQNLGLTIFVHAWWAWSGPRCISRLLVQSWSWPWSGDSWSDYLFTHGGHAQDQDAFHDSLCTLGLGLGPGLVRVLYAYLV